MEIFVAPILSAALSKFKKIVRRHSEKGEDGGTNLVVFCEDRLSLAAERAVCEEVGGTFSVSVYTLSRFLSSEAGRCEDVLTSQGSAMAVKRLIEAKKDELQLFRRLSTPAAAQDVYDTIALLYSSAVSPEDLSGLDVGDRLLKKKLHDLQLLYSEYSDYLDGSGAVDRNAYLRRLPKIICRSQKIKGADVLFFGFQAFTSSVLDCVRACMRTAGSVTGIFIGGSEKKYVNEGWTAFAAAAEETGGKEEVKKFKMPSGLCPAAEHLRRHILEPESYLKADRLAISAGQLSVVQAADEEEECEFIAAQILKRVKEDGVRYREISVMLPDVAAYQPALERAFGEYGLPYYVDRRYPLSTHPVCAFISDFLSCAIDGCRRESVIAAVSSPLFAPVAARADKDVFINYLLRTSAARVNFRRPVNEAICSDEGIDCKSVERVMTAFGGAIKLFPNAKGQGAALCAAVRNLLTYVDAEKNLKTLAEEAEKSGYPSVAAMSDRAYESVLNVLSEAEKLTAGDRFTLREFANILRSGFAAAEVSLIPPKQDAVFVGDLSKCANTGSRVLFVGGLTDGVPAASQDTAILTDGELASLEKLKVAVSPKISQVNRRVRETTALNLCAFSDALCLSYPLKSGGEECGASEIIGYVSKLFSVEGQPLTPDSVRHIAARIDNFPYFNARYAPARRNLNLYKNGDLAADEKLMAAVNKVMGGESDAVIDGESVDFSLLYGGKVSPTSLENYFLCPYQAFLSQGLRLSERREGALRPLDSGNFIHSVLERVAEKLNDLESGEQCAALAEKIASELIQKPSYSVSEGDGSAEYAAAALTEEAKALSLGMYEQLKNSLFRVAETESRCEIDLGGGLKVDGRIDRVDKYNDLVRIIDYKTGSIDDAPTSYYMGLKLQLPLYLTAVSRDKRAAGAYYFPANLDYGAEARGVFTLRGFMDGSEEVVRCSDTTLQEKQRSAYVNATLGGRKSDKAMATEDFKDFLSYSEEIARRGAEGLTGGDITPSPVGGACERCRFASCCAYDAEKEGERVECKADCRTIAQIMRNKREGKL